VSIPALDEVRHLSSYHNVAPAVRVATHTTNAKAADDGAGTLNSIWWEQHVDVGVIQQKGRAAQ
jgi:hypothetical protein